MIIMIINDAIRTNYIKAKIDNTLQNNNHFVCGEKGETVNHISGCRKRAPKEVQD